MIVGEEHDEALSRESFAIYMAEGDVLFKQGEYKKALQSYSTALEIEPTDKNCLVARSKCHLQLGDSKAALKDAEAALEDDEKYIKGLYHKAEALYQMGDFEMGLVFYHRGNKLRPELQEFRLGIQKAQEAIDNSIGSPSKVKLENKGDLSFFTKQDEAKSKKPARMGYSKPMAKQQENKKKRPTKPEQTDAEKKTAKQLLGELYADKEYLDMLLRDDDLTRADTDSGNRIYDLVNEGLQYLDTRTEFWRQQKPMYARKREKEEAKGAREKNKQKPADPAKYILKNLEDIDAALADGRPRDALRQAQKVLRNVEGWSQDDVPEKQEFIANLHSCIGNAYLDMGKMPDAQQNHQRDLDISKDNDNEEGRSRALDNLGRVYARIGKFDAAVAHWSEKLPLVKSALEGTWLYHEIGRCHLELGDYQEARDCGQKSLQAAQEAGDDVWQLNASVLIAQSEVKLGDLQEAIESFERALEMAKVQGDEPAQKAISKALEDLNEKIVQGLQEKEAEGDVLPEEQDGQKKEEEEEKKEEQKEEEAPRVHRGIKISSQQKEEEANDAEVDVGQAKEEEKPEEAEVPQQKEDDVQQKEEEKEEKAKADDSRSSSRSSKSKASSRSSSRSSHRSRKKSGSSSSDDESKKDGK
ncbi:outer dynein arm-docking complex subunit 4-like [Diadema antillarum]|uniref:outer dynein arm-docking complex subunit 4-like n=1 Tax=Diadema antillarum TaxID=105358 RepID=UPI003A83E6E4